MGGKKNKGGKGQGRPHQRVPTSGDSNSGKHMTQQNKVEGGNPKKDSDTHTDAAQEETLQPHVPVAPDTDNWEKYAEGATIQMDSSQTIPETNFDDEIEQQAIHHQYQKDNKRTKKGSKSQVPNGAPFNMTEVDGDLFDAPPEFSFAHCVARDMAMGAGIALRFRELFRGTGSLVDQHVKVGGVAHLEKNGRFVYYLVTKTHSSHKPTMKSMESSLLELKKLMASHNVKKLAIPEIGCGLDRLDWDDVKRLIKNIFSDTDVHIQVYHYKKR